MIQIYIPSNPDSQSGRLPPRMVKRAFCHLHGDMETVRMETEVL